MNFEMLRESEFSAIILLNFVCDVILMLLMSSRLFSIMQNILCSLTIFYVDAGGYDLQKSIILMNHVVRLMNK